MVNCLEANAVGWTINIDIQELYYWSQWWGVCNCWRQETYQGGHKIYNSERLTILEKALSLKSQVEADPISSIVQFKFKGSNWKIVRTVFHEVGGMRWRRYIFPDRSERKLNTNILWKKVTTIIDLILKNIYILHIMCVMHF